MIVPHRVEYFREVRTQEDCSNVIPIEAAIIQGEPLNRTLSCACVYPNRILMAITNMKILARSRRFRLRRFPVDCPYSPATRVVGYSVHRRRRPLFPPNQEHRCQSRGPGDTFCGSNVLVYPIYVCRYGTAWLVGFNILPLRCHNLLKAIRVPLDTKPTKESWFGKLIRHKISIEWLQYPA